METPGTQSCGISAHNSLGEEAIVYFDLVVAPVGRTPSGGGSESQPLQSRQQTREVVFEFIEAYYNRIRRHSNNGWLCPVQFEAAYNQALEASAA